MSYGGIWSICLPSNSIMPRFSLTTPEMVFSVVDFPAAFPPTRATISPSSTSSDIPWRTWRSPYATSISRTLSKEVLLSQVCLDHPLVLRDFRGRPLGDLLAVVQDDYPLGYIHSRGHDVLDHDQRDPAVPQPLDDAQHLHELRGVKSRHHLVE